MPINIPDGLTAKKTLQEERIFALEGSQRCRTPGDLSAAPAIFEFNA